MTENESTEVRRAIHGVLLPGFTGTSVPGWLEAAVHEGLAGVVLFAHNTPDVESTAALSARLHELAPRLLVAVDEEGGDVSRLEASTGSSLPGAAALGVVDDELLTDEAGEALGRLLAATGVDLDLAPVLDVSAPGNPVIGVRAFGSSPWLVTRHGVAFARGLHRAGVGACAKHFPGHGRTTTDSHLELPVVDGTLEELHRRDLPPFEAAFAPDADGGPGIDALMTAHVVVPALGPAPASIEPAVAALARELGHTGPIVTDALDMRAVSDGVHVGEAAVRAIEAGADLLCLGTTVGRDDQALFDEAVSALVAAVRDGRLTLERLLESTARTARAVGVIRQRQARARVQPGPDAVRTALAGLADVGERIAAQAVGTFGPGRDPMPDAPAGLDVVDLRLRLDHAAGRTAEHVQWAVAERWPGSTVHPSLGDDGIAGLVGTLREASPRPLVVVTREPLPGTTERSRLEALWSARPDLVVVHTGAPADVERWFGSLPGGAPSVVVACGTGRANAAAAVRVLAAGWSATSTPASAAAEPAETDGVAGSDDARGTASTKATP